jgi:choline dehydrogenase-like flavoprotein
VRQISSLSRDFLLTSFRDHYEEVVQFPIDIGDDIGGVYDWNISTVPQKQLDGASRGMPMGRVVGGGSIINGMIWNVCLHLQY